MIHRMGGCVLALALLSLAGRAGLAEDDLLDTVGMLLKQRQPGAVLSLFEGGAPKALQEDPVAVRRLCAQVEENARACTIATDGDGTTASLIAIVVGIADASLGKSGDSADAHRAKAHALGAQIRCEIAATRYKGDEGPWEECARLCLRAAELDAGRKALYTADAGRYLGEWLPHAGARQAEVRARTLETLKTGLASAPGDANLTSALGAMYVSEIRAAVAGGRKGDLKKIVPEALDALRPAKEPSSGREGDLLAGAFNEIISLAGENKLKVKDDYLSVERQSLDWTARHPRARGWDLTLSGDSTGELDLVCETDDCRVHIEMRKFSWDYKYTTPDGEAGGDNTGGMMKQTQSLSLAQFSKVEKHKPKVAGKLNKNVKKTTGYEISGLDADGKPYWVRGWVFKGDEHQRTYAVLVHVRGVAPESMPEVDWILENLRERPKK